MRFWNRSSLIVACRINAMSHDNFCKKRFFPRKCNALRKSTWTRCNVCGQFLIPNYTFPIHHLTTDIVALQNTIKHFNQKNKTKQRHWRTNSLFSRAYYFLRFKDTILLWQRQHIVSMVIGAICTEDVNCRIFVFGWWCRPVLWTSSINGSVIIFFASKWSRHLGTKHTMSLYTVRGFALFLAGKCTTAEIYLLWTTRG